jgi:hypothetical protein
MIDKKDLLKELEKKFEETKEDLGFQASLEGLDSVFFIKDFILSSGFVSEDFSRQLCSRIIDTYRGWSSYFHELLMPSSGNMFAQTESKLLSSKEDRENLWKISKKLMDFSSMHSLIGLKKDKVLEAKFIDETYNYWNEVLNEELIKIFEKVNENWKK